MGRQRLEEPARVRPRYGRMAADRLGVPAHLVLTRLGVGAKGLADGLAQPAVSASSPRPTPGQGAEEAMLRGLLWLGDSGATSLPLLIGSGATDETAAELLSVADGIIVGSAVKEDGVWWNAVDPARARRFASRARGG